MHTRFAWIVLALLLLSACSAPPPATLTIVPSAEATRTQTPIPSASATTVPSATPNFVATHTQRAAVEGTAEVEAILATNTAAVLALQASVTPRVLETLTAPDGARSAQVLVYGCTKIVASSMEERSYELLTVNGHVVAEQFQHCGGMGAGGLSGLFWSQNGRFFYFTDARDGVPDGGGPWIRPIHRYDTQTGDVAALDGPVASADGRLLAGGQGADLVVWDLEEGETARFAYPGGRDQTYVHAVAWSPDEGALAFSVQDCTTVDCDAILLTADLQSGSVRELARLPDAQINQMFWPEANTLRFFDYTVFNDVLFTIDSGALATITPQP